MKSRSYELKQLDSFLNRARRDTPQVLNSVWFLKQSKEPIRHAIRVVEQNDDQPASKFSSSARRNWKPIVPRA